MKLINDEGMNLRLINEMNILPTNHGNGTSFSPDGNYLSVAHSNSPFITIYKRDGDTFTKLNNPNILPSNTGNGTSFSPDGNYLSVAHSSSPYITIYKRDGDTFTKLNNPNILPTGHGKGTSFSPDGNYLSVAHYTSPFITIYKRDGDTFKFINGTHEFITSNGNGTSFSPDGNYLSVAHSNSPYITIYKSIRVEIILNGIHLSKTNLYITDIGNIVFKASIQTKDGNTLKSLTVTIDTEVGTFAESETATTPADININIPVENLNLGVNEFKVRIVEPDSAVEEVFKYNIIKEDRDTFTFLRRFDFKEDYMTDPNIDTTLGEGLTLKKYGEGEVVLDIPTEGKSTIKSVTVEGSDEGELIETPLLMDNISVIGEGRTYKKKVVPSEWGRLIKGMAVK